MKMASAKLVRASAKQGMNIEFLDRGSAEVGRTSTKVDRTSEQKNWTSAEPQEINNTPN